MEKISIFSVKDVAGLLGSPYPLRTSRTKKTAKKCQNKRTIKHGMR